jgi:hypothetical protein
MTRRRLGATGIMVAAGFASFRATSRRFLNVLCGKRATATEISHSYTQR